jgi:hypothetical protein
VASYAIHEQTDGLDVVIREMKGPVEPVLEALSACQAGRCGCPSDQYDKLRSLEVHEADGELRIEMRAKEDEVIDEAEVRRCLDYTFGELGAES